MARCQLRVYYGPEETQAATLTEKHDSVRLRLGDVLPMLADAIRGERTWLRDFEDDDISISTDLYEVLLAYQHYRRPSA